MNEPPKHSNKKTPTKPVEHWNRHRYKGNFLKKIFFSPIGYIVIKTIFFSDNFQALWIISPKNSCHGFFKAYSYLLKWRWNFENCFINKKVMAIWVTLIFVIFGHLGNFRHPPPPGGWAEKIFFLIILSFYVGPMFLQRLRRIEYGHFHGWLISPEWPETTPPPGGSAEKMISW